VHDVHPAVRPGCYRCNLCCTSTQHAAHVAMQGLSGRVM
jgi:hypothetical protein